MKDFNFRVKSKKLNNILIQTILYLTICFLCILFAFPLFWMISTAFKPNEQIFAEPPIWIPKPLTFENFKNAWSTLPFSLFLKNTVIITITATIGIILSSSLVGFAFAYLEWPGRDVWFVIMLSTMMLPAQVTMIPVFIIFTKLGWVNTFKPLIVPAYFGGGAFYIFLLRQFFLTIPRELFDSASIDGCSTLDIFIRIAIPLVKPALSAVAIFSFMGHWNDFMGPLIYLRSTEKYTLSLGINMFRGYEGITMWGELMAVSLVAAIPCLVIFFIAQKYFIQGITLTGLKG
ncbi:MAG: carbohydrate ABC transporter permease [archaeon YNP-WB-062]|nr:carbohydrate ABC transporter permease [Candidatus Culexarchaeum yellowstonense]